MWEDKYELWLDSLGDGKIVERIATDLDLRVACLLIRAYMEEYYHDLRFGLILKHMPQEEHDE
jgi:hypothetical protein